MAKRRKKAREREWKGKAALALAFACLAAWLVFKPAAVPKPLRLAFVANEGQAWNRALQAGAMKAAAESQARLEWIRPAESFKRGAWAGLVLCPRSAANAGGWLASASGVEIPAVLLDCPVKDGSQVAYVASSFTEAGRLAAEWMRALLRGRGRVALLHPGNGASAAEGFIKALETMPGMKLAGRQDAGPSKSSAQKAAAQLLSTYAGAPGKGGLRGIFCTDEVATLGMLEALDRAGLRGKIQVVGLGDSPAFLEALEQGRLHGFVVEDSFMKGYLAVKTLVAHLKGLRQGIQTAGFVLVQIQNKKEARIQELLNLP